MGSADDRFNDHLKERDRSATPSSSTRIYGERTELKGLIGEKIGCNHFGATQDLRNKRGGDGGVDLEVFLEENDGKGWVKLNFRGTPNGGPLKPNKAAQLIVDCDKVRPDIVYVLAIITDYDRREGYCLGWQWGADMMAITPREILGQMAHATSLLRPMSELDEAYFGEWRHSDAGL
jgi:hypothetical protein